MIDVIDARKNASTMMIEAAVKRMLIKGSLS